MSRIRRRTSGNAHASEGDRVPKRTHAHTFAHVYLHIFRTWALDTLVARGKKRGEEKSRFLQKLNVFMQWNRGNNCEVLTIRVKRWKDWGHKCHVGLIVGEFRKSFFLSFSFTLSGPTTPCQALLRVYPWRLVLSSIAWYFWSWVSFAEPKHSSLSYNSIKKKAMIESCPSCDSWSPRQTTVTNTFMGITEIAFCMMFDVELSLRIISYFGEEHSGGISAQIQIKSKRSRDSESKNSRAASKAAATLV